MPHLSWPEIFIGFGVMITLYSWIVALDRKGRAVGTIVKIERESGTDARSVVAIVEYEVGKTKYRFQPSMSLPGETRRSSIGRKLPVVYNPAHPEDAEVGGIMRSYIGPVILTVFFAAAAWWLFKGRLDW